jgi:DNA polymerase-3 subunit gamma/tau
MGQALYRTYRSKKLAEIVGQEHITTALEHALKKGTISHAYLFTGPRGTGKTSIARILAHEINGLPYSDETTHLDIIEIDAASNRRIDEIRDLRDKVHIAPTSAKYKVYIIDEVHMLTREAFNALLKTLEEPPAHVVFILATTEVHKLPETIISRTQRYAFKPVDQDQVIAHLKHIATNEKIKIADDALALIAAHGEGSFRDSISLLDQIRNSDTKVTLADVQAMLGIAPAEVIEQIAASIAAHDAVAVVQNLQQMKDQGYEPAQIARQLGTYLRQGLIEGKPVLAAELLLALLAKLVEVPNSADPQTYLDLVLLAATFAGNAPQSAQPTPVAAAPAVSTAIAAAAKLPAVPPAPVQEPKKTEKPVEKPAAHMPKPAAKPAPIEKPEPTSFGTAVLDNANWGQFLEALKKDYNTLHSVLKSAGTRFEPGKVTLYFTHNFHRKRVHEAKNREIIADVLKKITGQDLQIICEVGERPDDTNAPLDMPEAVPTPIEQVKAPAKTDAKKSAGNHLETVSNIFGGGELIES